MYYYIINPKSRSHKGLEIWGQVQRELHTQGVLFRYFFTRYRGHARKLASQISAIIQKDDVLVVIGGDGTMNEVINGLSNRSDITLGYIPTGSGNDFANGMNIPTNISSALQLLLNPVHISKLDIGCIRCGKRKRLFGVSTGIGFDASVCYEALSSPLKIILNKIHLGKLTYAVIAMKQLLSFHPFDIELLLDDCKRLSFKKVYFTAVMNQRYEGGGFKFCPNASPNDGHLDIIVVAGLPKWKVLLLFPTAFFGKHTKIKGIHILKGRQVHIKSQHKYHTHVDGEFAGMQSDLHVSLMTEHLNVITN